MGKDHLAHLDCTSKHSGLNYQLQRQPAPLLLVASLTAASSALLAPPPRDIERILFWSEDSITWLMPAITVEIEPPPLLSSTLTDTKVTLFATPTMAPPIVPAAAESDTQRQCQHRQGVRWAAPLPAWRLKVTALQRCSRMCACAQLSSCGAVAVGHANCCLSDSVPALSQLTVVCAVAIEVAAVAAGESIKAASARQEDTASKLCVTTLQGTGKPHASVSACRHPPVLPPAPLTRMPVSATNTWTPVP